VEPRKERDATTEVCKYLLSMHVFAHKCINSFRLVVMYFSEEHKKQMNCKCLASHSGLTGFI